MLNYTAFYADVKRFVNKSPSQTSGRLLFNFDRCRIRLTRCPHRSKISVWLWRQNSRLRQHYRVAVQLTDLYDRHKVSVPSLNLLRDNYGPKYEKVRRIRIFGSGRFSDISGSVRPKLAAPAQAGKVTQWAQGSDVADAEGRIGNSNRPRP